MYNAYTPIKRFSPSKQLPNFITFKEDAVEQNRNKRDSAANTSQQDFK